MFQQKINNIFPDIPKVFLHCDDLLIVGYEDNDRDHDEMMQTVLQRCRKVNL